MVARLAAASAARGGLFTAAWRAQLTPRARVQFTKAFPDKNAQLVVGCLSGKRSMAACDILSNNGYSNLSNVEGGYQAWTGAGLPVEA